MDHLASLADKGCRVGGLLRLLCAAAAAALPAHPQYEALLQSLLTRVPVGDAARPLADAVLAVAAAGGEAAQAQRELHMRLLRTLDLRAPEALDAAVDAALPAIKPAQAAGEGGDGAGEDAASDGGEGGEEEQGEDAQRRSRVLELLAAAFEGTARCPLLEAGTTVLLAAEAPSAAVRQLVSCGGEGG